ncbi:hypothetical protein Droror1_Dr00021196 [Drosera rotundifolia]
MGGDEGEELGGSLSGEQGAGGVQLLTLISLGRRMDGGDGEELGGGLAGGLGNGLGEIWGKEERKRRKGEVVEDLRRRDLLVFLLVVAGIRVLKMGLAVAASEEYVDFIIEEDKQKFALFEGVDSIETSGTVAEKKQEQWPERRRRRGRERWAAVWAAA